MAPSRKTFLLLSGAMFLASTAAAAQSGPARSGPTSGTAPDADGTQSGQAPSGQDAADTGLRDIIVTAQQRGESLQKAAVPVAVVEGADLTRRGVTGLDTLDKLVPALQITTGGQGNLIFIRGVGNFSFTPSTDPAAAFNFDGVYVGRSSSTVGNFFDIDRVEVLKGPQGTLYGRNATAGAINILPVQPRIGEWSGYATASYGNYNALISEGAINAALGGNAALRVSGSYTRHDGYLRDGTTADDSGAIRAQMKVELTPDITVRIAGDYAHEGGVAFGSSYVGRYALNPATGQFVVTPSNIPVENGLYSPDAAAFRLTGAAGTLPGRFLDPLARLPFSNNSIYGFRAYLDWKTPLGTVSVIPSWSHAIKDNFNVNSGGNVGDTANSYQYTVEARLVSNPGRLFDYIVGAYYFDEEVKDDTHNDTGANANFIAQRYTTHSPSAYGRLTLKATPWLRFTGGIRYTSDAKTADIASTTLAVACTIVANCPKAPLLPYTLTLAQQPVVPATNGGTALLAPGVVVARRNAAISQQFTTDKVTYRGAVEIDLRASSLLYGSVETGYRAGGLNTDGSSYTPETITAFTVGSKNRFLNNHLQLNAEVFQWEYRNQQLSHAAIDAFGRTAVLTQNVGRSRIRGAEVEGRVLLPTRTTLGADLQFLDAKYQSFVYTSPARVFTGCGVTAGTLFTIDCSGQPGLNAPRWTVNLSAQQVVPVGSLLLTLGAETQHKTGYYVNFDYTAPEYQKGFWHTDAEAAIGPADGRWSVGAFIRNIENYRQATFVTGSPGSNLIVSTNAPPRTYGARATVRF